MESEVEEPYILLTGAAGKSVDEENRFGILKTEGHCRAAVFRLDGHADGKIRGHRVWLDRGIVGSIVAVEHFRILQIDNNVMLHG